MNAARLYVSNSPENAANILRQTPGGKGIWKDHQFYINEGNEPYDTLVVFANYSKIIRTSVPKEQRIFIAGEPPQMKHYPDNSLAQFGTVISSHTSIQHPNTHIEQQGYTWFAGIQFEDNRHLKAQSAIRESKRRVLENYNMFNLITQHIERIELEAITDPAKSAKIYPRKWFEKGLKTRLQLALKDLFS